MKRLLLALLLKKSLTVSLFGQIIEMELKTGNSDYK